MNPTLRAILHLALADWRERVRRHAFLVTMLVTVWFGWVALPPNHSRYATLQISGTRGVYDSAWVGATVALLTSVSLSFVGFWVVKNAVDRDRTSRVGEILATTPISRPAYTLGKAVSNFAVLASIVLVMVAMAGVMQIVRGEDRHLHVVQLAVPFLLVTLPAVAVVAALAVLFETIPGLRGGFGNVVWFFFAPAVLFAPSMTASGHGWAGRDVLGATTMVPDMVRAQSVAYPGAHADTSFSLGFNFKKQGTWDFRLFRWNGIAWTPERVALRLSWFVVAIGIAGLAAIPFDRFDAVRPMWPAGRRRKRSDVPQDQAGPDDAAGARVAPARSSSALPAVRRGGAMLPLVNAEIVLTLRALPKVAWVVPLGLCVAQCFAPLGVARGWLLPIAWIWPILAWSPLGAREQRHQVSPLVLSAPRPVLRPIAAAWIAGVAIALATGAPVIARLLLAGETSGAVTALVGAAFVPALALAAGTWTGSGKLFEALYAALWYIGPMNRVPVFDYVGVTAASAASGAWIAFAAATPVLLVLAAIGRRRLLR